MVARYIVCIIIVHATLKGPLGAIMKGIIESVDSISRDERDFH